MVHVYDDGRVFVVSFSVKLQELLKIFVTNFAPNKEFYSAPGSPKFQAYFGAVNAAQLEMLNNPALFKAATGRSTEELLDMVNHPKPGITSMLICGMIWCVGDYAVIPDRVLCVDFCEKIPNCIALYLLLTAERQTEGSRKQILDAGDGTDRKPLQKALTALQVCDPGWEPKIF